MAASTPPLNTTTTLCRQIKVTREELLEFSEKASYFKFEKTQHSLTFNYVMLVNGLAILALTSCTAIVR